MEQFRQRYLEPLGEVPLRIIDLGSQDVNGSYRPLFAGPKWEYRGLDLSPGKNVGIVLADPYRWNAVASGTVDVCISGQALEHIPYFWLIALEIERVLKPGGLCCIIAPSGGYEHRYPVDCWRFYPDGFAALALFARLDIEEVYTDWTPGTYPDDSAVWKDSVLVARKPHRGRLAGWRNRVRASLLRKLSTAGMRSQPLASMPITPNIQRPHGATHWDTP